MQKRSFNFAHETNATLSNNTKFKFAHSHALSLYHPKAIYSFIPKNGCTTLRASLATANGFIDDANAQINWIHNNSYTFSATLSELVTARYTFTILRCPFSRLVSMFLDKFVDKTPVAWTFYRSSNNRFDPDNITFSNFIHLLIEQPQLINADIHWKRQNDFLVYKNYDNYFDFNNFREIEKILKDKINLDLVDTRSITGHGREKYTELDHNNYSDIEASKLKLLKAEGQLPSVDSMFNEELKDKVKKIYEVDFSLRKSVI